MTIVYNKQEKTAIAILGCFGAIANVAAIWYRYGKPGLASKLYAVLSLIDVTTCILMILEPTGTCRSDENRSCMNYVLYANQASAIWTCVISATRLIVLTKPFYKIKERWLWGISLPVTVVFTAKNWLAFRYLVILLVLYGTNLVVISIITVMTCVILRQRSFISETEKAKKRATVTILIITTFFLITNSFGFIIPLFIILPGTLDLWISAQKVWPFVITLNSVVNPVVILFSSESSSDVFCLKQREDMFLRWSQRPQWSRARRWSRKSFVRNRRHATVTTVLNYDVGDDSVKSDPV